MEWNKGVKEIEIEGERVFLKKGFLGWSVIHPVKIDGKINWKNLIAGGNWGNLMIILVFLVICLGAIFEVSDIYNLANQCLNQTSNLSLNVTQII